MVVSEKGQKKMSGNFRGMEDFPPLLTAFEPESQVK